MSESTDRSNKELGSAPLSGDVPSPDLTDIELELISMGLVPVPDEHGNTNWVQPDRLGSSNIDTTDQP